MTLEHLQHTAPSRTRLVAATAAALAIGLSVFSTPSYSQTMTISDGETTLAQATSKQRVRGEDRSIRPFKAHIPQAQIDDLRRRIKATRFPESETVDDFSQGVQLAKLKPLVEYWGTKYDWRKAEARLNALPQFVTHIDGLDIHFIHVRSRHPNALPMLMPHGWPGSVFELLKVVDPLVNPTAPAAARKTPSISCCPRYQAMASRASRSKPRRGVLTRWVARFTS